MVNSVIASLFLLPVSFAFGAVLFVVNATAPSFWMHRLDGFADGERSCWRLAARKALILRRVTPTT